MHGILFVTEVVEGECWSYFKVLAQVGDKKVSLQEIALTTVDYT